MLTVRLQVRKSREKTRLSAWRSWISAAGQARPDAGCAKHPARRCIQHRDRARPGLVERYYHPANWKDHDNVNT